jgi:hypothetical protein|tara:strand:- start:167 stop:790 length:624 start_codon:yes stop_codon:yes gene_type:complete|eukprot:GHVR01192054.1.p3 GENE.GHVR01192054.1~~GHVR01192054.1.p3  ORF type:complete len:208 (-),score=53.50 GHVR01192054.1:759-1382(-)
MAMLAPIPGQSLTDEPQNFAWERPPEIVDPNEAIKFHMDRLSEKPVVESVMFLMELGYPVDILTRSMLTASVGEGIHTIDVSMIVAPVIEEELSYMARTAGIEYKETFANDQTEDEIQEEKLRILINQKLEDNLGKQDKSFARSVVEELGTPAEDDLEAMQDSITPEQEAEQQGLMDAGADEMEDPMLTEEMSDPSQSGQGLMSRGV